MNVADYLNDLDDDSCRSTLEKCCAATSWIEGMMGRRPFAPEDQVVLAADEVWWSLDATDWHEAFAAHPRIGDVASLRAKFANTRDWASGEQAGVAAASTDTLEAIATANDKYFAKFGYIFIVCATGKSADEMLALIESRLQNVPEHEVEIAAREQLKITQLRLQKLTSDEP